MPCFHGRSHELKPAQIYVPEIHIPVASAWEPYVLTATGVRGLLTSIQISCYRLMRWQVCDSRELLTHI